MLVGPGGGGYRPAARDEVLLSESPTDLANEHVAALLQRSAEGDRAAFRRLYDLQSSRLYAVALRITRQSALAADAMHEAFVSVWQYADRFDPARGAGEAWPASSATGHSIWCAEACAK